jgi:hypothetical protein
MSDPNLYILKSDGNWVKTSNLPNFLKYRSMYFSIQLFLNNFEGKGSQSNGIYKNHVIYLGSNISVNCVYNESHRLCSILACTQYDQTTNGLRFVVYGTKYNLDSQYGIGTCLEGITVEYVNKWCPSNITSKHI